MELYQLDLIVEAYCKLVPSTREVDTHSKHVDHLTNRPWADTDLEWEG